MNWERIESVRWWGRSLLVIGVIAILTPALLWVSTPGFTYGGSRGPTVAGILISDLPTVIGFVGMFLGLAWMWRIYKAPTRYEDHAHWRYRERD
jgi:hypothetical protein